MEYSLRAASAEDLPTLRTLLPDLADFEVPGLRNPDDLWQGDAALLTKTINGEAPDTRAIVATYDQQTVVGLAMYTIKPELLSGATSTHLEALVVDQKHTRRGLAKRLINAVSTASVKEGAGSMSLHVFANNTRARALYKECGFDEELIRCYRPLWD